MYIREIKTIRGKNRYRVYARVGNKTFRKTCASRAIAEGFLSTLSVKKINLENRFTPKMTPLRDDQLRDAEAAVRLLGDRCNLLEAAECFKKNYIPAAREQTLSGAILHLLEHKEKAGRAPKTIESLKGDLMPFQKLLGADALISSITSKQAEDFVLSKKEKGTKIKTRKALTNLFNHCINQGWLMVDIMVHVVRISAESKRPQCFSVDDVEQIMKASEAYEGGEFSLYFALGFFAGLRPESEIERLTWDNINLDEGIITVDKSKKKTQIRHVTISENLRAWLLKYQGRPIIPAGNSSQLRSGLAAVRKAAGFESGCSKKIKAGTADADLRGWIKNGQRHSFASYLYAKENSFILVADQMGNTESVVKSHYRALVKKPDAEKFFSIMPS